MTKTRADRIRWARDGAEDYLGGLEDMGLDTYPLQILIDVADEYLGFLEDASDGLDDMRDCLSRAVTALAVALDGMDEDDDIREAFEDIGCALEAVDAVKKDIDEVDP